MVRVFEFLKEEGMPSVDFMARLLDAGKGKFE